MRERATSSSSDRRHDRHESYVKLARLFLGIVLIFGTIAMTASSCGRAAARPPSVAAALAQTSSSCRECHEEIQRAWAGTDHALANRVFDPQADAAALATFPSSAPNSAGPAPEFILGHKPLWQPLIPFPGGRWQPHEQAYDPAKHEWFNVFGAENRRPGEWGHWTGRGMNWNSMCASCHMTGYRKNYRASDDSYASSWVEHGVGCIQCHGPMRYDHGRAPKAAAPLSPPPPFFGNRQKMMETCAPCHARNQTLTDTFQPGDDYAQHYRMVLPVSSATYYPDGQQRDEDFNWTSVQLSRMAHAGVTCFDCHNPHTLKTVLPANDNQLCLQCHAAPGREQPNGTRAIPIDPTAHSHHPANSTGNQCISCHMPTTNYMQRAPRHDHGWLKPDPLLTRELGIPNACSKCHSDQPLAWNIEKANEWYGTKMESHQRARTRAIAAAQADKPGAAADLLEQLAIEDIPAWRATLLTLLAQCTDRDETKVRAAAQRALSATEPLERSAGINLLSSLPDGADLIRPLLNDPTRLVRLDAEWALSRELAADSPGRKELDQHLALDLDQPSGRFRIAQDLANRGRLPEAERELATAIQWDPFSPAFYDSLAMIKASEGQTAEAAEAMKRAAELDPQSGPQALRAALLASEAGRSSDAEHWLRIAIQRDPTLDRAWYNLGLLLAGRDSLSEAETALERAQSLRPTSADYPYALATVLLRRGDENRARAALIRALSLDPQHQPAAQLLRRIGG